MTERRREALSHIAGPVAVEGDPRLGRWLARAWEQASQSDADALTHGFHAWPARMHWAIARTLIEEQKPRDVLDPFCGGGTVLIEARVAGARSAGVDLSPLARRVADVKTQVRDARSRARFVAIAEEVAAESEARVRTREPIHVDLPPSELRWFSGHVIKELGGLREQIAAVSEREDRRALAIVFSSILTKVSKQRADTSERETVKRIRKGLATELFLRKAHELSERWASLAAVARGPAPRILEGDARDVGELFGERQFDLVVTSPPYGGTYDYASHHARRLAWLGLDARRLADLEIGARRRAQPASWDREVLEVLRALQSILRSDGGVVLVMGDARLGGRRVPAPAQIARLAAQTKLRMLAVASQPRRDWRGGPDRAEHLIALAITD